MSMPFMYQKLCGCIVLVNGQRQYLTLTDLKAHTTILASTSKTTLTQTFANDVFGSLPEARYTFPLYDGVSVVGFKCTIGDRVINGVVQERKEAKKTFDAAVERGETAGLLEQSVQASDVFTTTLGNVPANTSVKVEITYIGELEHDAEVDGVRFTIPTAIVPRYGTGPSTHNSSFGGKMSFTIDADMGKDCPIKMIQSPSHPISVSIGNLSTDAAAAPSLQRASATLSLNSTTLDKDFVVHVVAASVGNPVAMLETHPTMANQRALMTSLVPRFNLPVQKPEVVFICDRSGSMDGQITNLVSALQIFLKSLPVGVRFNICSFGSRFDFLWRESQLYDQNSLDKAVAHVKTFRADYGGTEMYDPVEATFKRRLSHMDLEVFLLTDGAIWDQQALFTLIESEVKSSNGAIRVFTLGVGTGASSALINGIARAGNGFAQTTAEDEKMDKKIVRMLKGALTPHVKDYTLEIKYEKADSAASSDGEHTPAASDDEDFELVEKVMDALTIGVANDTKSPSTEKGDNASSTPVKPISLFDSDVSNDQLQMPEKNEKDMPKPPDVPAPRYLQSPFDIPPLFPFIRTTVYVLFSDQTPSRVPKSVILKGNSTQGPLELEIPITALDSQGTMLHQLGARKAMQELEEGRGWLYHAKDAKGHLLKDSYESTFASMVEREAVRLGVKYQVGGKYCSFVAVQESESSDTKSGENDGSLLVQHTISSTMVNDPISVTHSAGATKHYSRIAKHSGFGSFLSAFARPAAKLASAPSVPIPQPNCVEDALGSPGSLGQQLAWTMASPDMETQVCWEAEEEAEGIDVFDEEDFARQREAEKYDVALDMCCEEIPETRSPAALSYSPTEMKKRRMSEDSDHAGMGLIDAVQELAGLQTFKGSWSWSARLEAIIGVTEQQAASQRFISSAESGTDVDDVVATLCVYMFLKVKMADEIGSWELMADKAQRWLVDEAGQDMARLEQLVRGAGIF